MSDLVVVAMGGPSGEYDVSLNSGRAVVANLAKAGYDVIPMWIGRDLKVAFELPQDNLTPDMPFVEALIRLQEMDPYVVFIAMHGPFGEDGQLQGILESLGIPFTGSDHYGAAVSMDKVLSKAVYISAGLKVADHILVYKTDPDRADECAHVLGLPVVIKTPRSGSSVGVDIAKDVFAIKKTLFEFFQYEDRVICERFIKGRELTVPVMDKDGIGKALPPIEIRVKTHEFFDYEAKYDPDLTDEICPAPISEDLKARLSEQAIKAHRALGLYGLSRTDFIVDEKGDIYVLETNAIPGLTEVSLVPKSAKVAGIEFPDFLSILVEEARQHFFR